MGWNDNMKSTSNLNGYMETHLEAAVDKCLIQIEHQAFPTNMLDLEPRDEAELSDPLQKREGLE